MLSSLKNDLVPLVLRLALATILISHGYFKLTVGEGFRWAPTLEPEVATTVAWGEVIGGIALGIGLLSRLAAVGIGVIQVGAILLVTGNREFIQNQALKNEPGFNFSFRAGWEYNFALLAMCFCIVVLGSGFFSVDHFLWKRLRESRQSSATKARVPV